MRIGNVRGRPWLLAADTVGVDVHEASGHRFGPRFPDLFDDWDRFTEWAHGFAGDGASFAVEDLGAPSPEPRQVFAVGLNYHDHAEEANLALPPEPSVFTKFVSSFAGPCTTVVLPGATVDWEVELVVVIGRAARHVRASEAWSHVAGLSVGQDLSERTRQTIGNPAQYSLGKSFPRFSPIGPALVTPDELRHPDDLALGCRLNGEAVQKSRTSQLVFGVDVIVERLSAIVTLYPGDVIFTGTPAGVGAARKPPRYLQPGDELVSFVEGIGEIRQTFVAPAERRS